MREKLQQKNIEKIFWVSVMFFLCCYFAMVFDFANRITILVGSIICLLIIKKQKCFRLDLNTCLLIIAIGAYYLIVHGTRAFSMSLPYVGILLYVIGNYLSSEVKQKDNYEKIYLLLLVMLIVGHTIHGALNSFLFLDGQFYQDDFRVWMDIWMQITLPGTQQVVYFLPALAMVFPAIAYFKNRKVFHIIMLVSAAFFIYISMASQTRTSVLILPLVFVAQLVLYVILEWKNIKRLLSYKETKIVLLILVLAMLAAVFLLRNHPLVTSFLSIMGRDGGILNNIRFKLQRAALEQLPLYPFGGDQMNFMGYPYAHNAWLDMANEAGWIPFGAYAIYTFHVVYELIRWLMKKEVSAERKIILAGLFGAFFLYYTVERAFDGSLHFMTPWHFINGLVHGELKKDKVCTRG